MPHQLRDLISPVAGRTHYWKHLPTGQPRLYNPFPRLRTSGLWHLHARAGRESALTATRSFQSVSHLKKLVAYAGLDPELFTLLQHPEAREVVRQIIVETHLSCYAPLIRKATTENQLINEAAQKLRREALSREDESAPTSTARSAAFRQEVVRLYDYTCAACRLGIITLEGKSAVTGTVLSLIACRAPA